MAQPFDPYRSLGVPRSASEAEIKSAHRRLAKRYHPDAAKSDTALFLQVQEAYRVLSNPLLRREWDTNHAPGPIRADRPTEPTPRTGRSARTGRRSTTGKQRSDAGDPPADDVPHAADEQRPAGPGRPRSARAYTWSASEVPWWEEGVQRQARRQSRRKRTTRDASGPGPQAEPAPEAGREFDVYNRSSGAAWSMAARAFFRRGDQDLPSRGSFRHQGTQPLTAARARAAAEAEARSRTAPHGPSTATAAAASAASVSPASPRTAAAKSTFTYPSAGVARDSAGIHRVREAVRRRARAQTWPSLRERMIYALLAWVPVALVLGYGGSTATGCDRGSLACPAYLETGQAILIALSLGLLVALPRVAYVGAMASLGALLIGLAMVGLFAFARVQTPLSTELTAGFAGALMLAYLATAALTIMRGRGKQPWSAVRPT